MLVPMQVHELSTAPPKSELVNQLAASTVPPDCLMNGPLKSAAICLTHRLIKSAGKAASPPVHSACHCCCCAIFWRAGVRRMFRILRLHYSLSMCHFRGHFHFFYLPANPAMLWSILVLAQSRRLAGKRVCMNRATQLGERFLSCVRSRCHSCPISDQLEAMATP